jgi:hypothetical protein
VLTDELLKYCDAETTTLALGEGYFGVQQDGTCWWSDIPKTLYNKVDGRIRGQPEKAGVDYVALGPDDNYFVQFEDGGQWWVGPPSLTEALNEGCGAVEVLAFAPDNGWYVMWEDGDSAWEGIPRGLHNQVNGRMNGMPEGAAAATVEELAIGPGEEWFVRYANGDWRMNASQDVFHAIDELQDQGHEIVSVAFGHDDTWAIRY